MNRKPSPTRRLITITLLLLAAVAPLLAQQASFEKDVVYGKTGDEQLHLDLALPANTNAPAPCVLVIHGGGWRGGNKNDLDQLARDFAQRGYVSASVAYRFCPKYPFPAQVEDVKCAVRFLRANAAKYHLDPARIGAVGFSAGAHLSMMLGVMSKEDGLEGDGGWPDQSSRVQAVVAYFGPTDFSRGDFPQASAGLVKDFLGGTFEEKPAAYKQASPLTYVRHDAAPLLIFQGTKDPLVPHVQAFRMIEAMTTAGAPGRVEILVNAGHGWGGQDMQRTMQETFAFFEQHLKPK